MIQTPEAEVQSRINKYKLVKKYKKIKKIHVILLEFYIESPVEAKL